MRIGYVLLKCSPVNVVVDCEYMFSIRFITSFGYPRSCIMVSSLASSIEPKTFLKSMYRMYMFWFVNLVSSSAAINI